MISANDVTKEVPKKEVEDVVLGDVYNALRIAIKVLLNIRTNQVAIGKAGGVDFKSAKPSADEEKVSE